jgi:hypothetical protein
MSSKLFLASGIACRAMSMTRVSAKSTLLTVVPLLLAGCAINKDLRLDRQGPGLPASAAVAIETAPAATEQAARFAEALANAFAKRGHGVSDEAPVSAVFAFTQRHRSIGTADGSPAAAGSKPETQWISAPGRKRRFQSCEGERLRATLALYSRTDKALIYRAAAEVDGCDFTNADIDALAKALVDGAAR